MVFHATEELRLYAYHLKDTVDDDKWKYHQSETALTTVAENQSKFSVREVKLAQQARE